MPNFRGVRLANAHETLIWASKDRQARYIFNYQVMKAHNDDLQMRSDWVLPICTGAERIKINGKKAHSTQKPEALLYRILMASTQPGDIVLDPFIGTGTTGAAARRLHRHFIGMEQDITYANLARQRIASIEPEPYEDVIFNVSPPRLQATRISMGALLENNLLNPGQTVYFDAERTRTARVRADGHLVMDGLTGSIHQLASQLQNGSPCNGWEMWYFENQEGRLSPLDELRKRMRQMIENPPSI
jgi:modification methylase